MQEKLLLQRDQDPAPSPGVPVPTMSKTLQLLFGDVFVLICPGGETIKSLQERSDTKMVITKGGSSPDTRILEITGTADSIAMAERLITDILDEAKSGNVKDQMGASSSASEGPAEKQD